MDKVGIIQMTSGPDPKENLAYIADRARELANRGAEWVVTPENALVFGRREDYHRVAEPLDNGILQLQIAQLAAELSIWIVIGSMPIRRDGKVMTTCLVFNPQGERVAHYDKLHMFDVDVADTHHRYRESETFCPGNEIVAAPTQFGVLGLSICYDLRFPHLYSELRRLGAQILLVPAAFTAVTGRAHWETLLRARAIETQCWVVAVNQGGTHPCGRETWGHSMVISPWGEVTGHLEQQAGTMLTSIDLEPLEQLRSAMPVASHTRFDNQFTERKSKI